MPTGNVEVTLQVDARPLTQAIRRADRQMRRDLARMKQTRKYGCAKRGCDAVNPAYLSFKASNGKGYCLGHRPLRSRIRCWWQERRA